MLRGNVKIIYVRFILPFMKNGRSFESRDEISIRGTGFNTLGVRLALLHLHFMSTSIIEAFMGMSIRSFISFTLSLSHVMLLIYIHMLVIMGDQCEKWL